MAIDTVEAQLAVEQAEVDRLRTLHDVRQQQMADLHVRAGMPGVLQQVPLDEGQRITTGTNLARVGDPTIRRPSSASRRRRPRTCGPPGEGRPGGDGGADGRSGAGGADVGSDG